PSSFQTSTSNLGIVLVPVVVSLPPGPPCCFSSPEATAVGAEERLAVVGEGEGAGEEEPRLSSNRPRSSPAHVVRSYVTPSTTTARTAARRLGDSGVSCRVAG